MTTIIRITVTKRDPDEFLHELDTEVPGEYGYFIHSETNPEDTALDLFHSTVPIKVLDDFVIIAEIVHEKELSNFVTGPEIANKIVQQTSMTTFEAIRSIIEYNWQDEERDFEENPPDEGYEESHIFTALKKLNQEFPK